MIPAAGRAARLGGAPGPKALLQVGGTTLVERLLDDLAPVVTDACVVASAGWIGPVRARLGARRGAIRLQYAIQPRPLGVADAVGRAAGVARGPFVVVMGDAYYEQPLTPAVQSWRAGKADGAILVEPAGGSGADPVGLVRLDGDRVVAIRKAPDDGDADARVCGMVCLPAAAMPALRAARPGESGETELEDVIRALMAEGAVFCAIPYRGWRRNINGRSDLEAVRRRAARTTAGLSAGARA